MDLRGCDEGRAGINIFMDNLVRALEGQKKQLPTPARGKNKAEHPYLFSLVELAEVVDQCSGAGEVEARTGSIYYKYCAFFLEQIAKTPQINSKGNLTKPDAQIKRAVLEFEQRKS
jgi:hypothetical protein